MKTLSGIDMNKPVSDEAFDKMPAGYSPELKANTRAERDFLNSVMRLPPLDAVGALDRMRAACEVILGNLAVFALAESKKDVPADATRPIGDIFNEVLRKQEADAGSRAPAGAVLN